MGIFGNKIQKQIDELKRQQSELPMELAIAGKSFFQKEFNSSSWDGKPWKPRKDTKNKKHLLVGTTGDLRKSLQNSIRHADWKYIEWGDDLYYAKYHNFGTRYIPARQFMGFSKKFLEMIKKKIEKSVSKMARQ